MIELTGYNEVDHEEEMSDFWNNFLISIVKLKDPNSK